MAVATAAAMAEVERVAAAREAGKVGARVGVVMAVGATAAAMAAAAREGAAREVEMVAVVMVEAEMAAAMGAAEMEAVMEARRWPRQHSNARRASRMPRDSRRSAGCSPELRRAALQLGHDRTPPTSKPACRPDRIP